MSTAGWIPRRQVADLGDRALGLLVRLADELLRALGVGVGVELLLRAPEVHRQRDEPLLHPVVQVALDPAAVLGGEVDGGRARVGQRLHPLDHVAAEQAAD